MTIYTCERCGAKSDPIPGPGTPEQDAWDRHECPALVTMRQRGNICQLCREPWYRRELDYEFRSDGCLTEDCPNYIGEPVDEANICQLCRTEGPDMRSLRLCLRWNLGKILPEAELEEGGYWLNFYHIRTCKACRGSLLLKVKEWHDERVERRGRDMWPDGGDL